MSSSEYSPTSDSGSEDFEDPIFPVDDSSEGDDEVLAARDKRSWRNVALLQETDNEDSDEDELDREAKSGGDTLTVSDKSQYPVFKNHKGTPIFELGMLFNTNEEFKDAVNTYAIMTRHDIRLGRNEPGRCRFKCWGADDCPWLIFASYNKDISSFQVKTFFNEHTCEPKRELKRLTNKYLTGRFYKLIASYPDIKPRHLKPFMQENLGLEVSVQQCKRVKKNVLNDLAGNCLKEYEQLRDYAEELLVSNPGSTVSVLTTRENEDDPPVFKGFYCCFSSCKEGVLAGCRPVFGIDGCFLKGLVKGELLTAIGRDGNNQMFPIAWGVVLVESTDTWRWFLELLRIDLQSAAGEGWTIISDRQKGLVNAVAEIWPKSEHRFCCRHYYANWSKHFSGSHLKSLFWAIAKSSNKADFDLNLKELTRIHPDAAHDLMMVDPKYWCRAYFSPQSKCDSVDNNLCEAFNGTIVEARRKSIITMLEDIRRALMRRIRDKRIAVNTWKNDYGPLIHRKIVKNLKDSHVWECEWNGGGSYEVRYGKSQYVVKLRENVCSCGSWQLSGIPCPHAIRAINDTGGSVDDYIDLWYKCNTYLRAYQRPIEPIRGQNMWPKSKQDHVLPPKIRRMPGRPKKRRREHHEVIMKNKITREGKSMTCQICKGKGHNARNKMCPGKSGATTSSETSMSERLGSTSSPIAVTGDSGSSITPIPLVAPTTFQKKPSPPVTRAAALRRPPAPAPAPAPQVTRAYGLRRPPIPHVTRPAGLKKPPVTKASTLRITPIEPIAVTGVNDSSHVPMPLTAATGAISSSTTSIPPTAKYVSPHHAENRPKSKPRKRTLLQGLGVYINEETGRSILNPGTSMARVITRGTAKQKSNRQAGANGSHGGGKIV